LSINYVQKTSSCTISEHGQTKAAVVLTTATIATEYQTTTEKQLNIMATSGA